MIKDMKDVANKCNSFFRNVGPNLAKSIETHDLGKPSDNKGAGGGMLQSMFVDNVSED